MCRLCNLRPHLGRLYLQRHSALDRVPGFHNAQFSSADLRIDCVTATLGRENCVEDLLHLERNLIDGAECIGARAGRIRAGHLYSRPGLEKLRNRLRKSGRTQQEIGLALSQRYAGAW